jgi:hypothetical protein
MEPPNHYELLCVTPEATAEEIRASYRRLIRMYHPDAAGAAGAAMTLRLNEAQRVLLDPTLRRQLDERMRARLQPAGAGTRRPSQPAASFIPREHAEPSRPQPATQPAPSPGWTFAFFASALFIVVSTVVVIVFCYSGPLMLLTPRLIPAFVIALAWLVAGLSRPPKFFIAMLGLSALLWPVVESGIPYFDSLAYAVPGGMWALLTFVSIAVLVFRLSLTRGLVRTPAPKGR